MVARPHVEPVTTIPGGDLYRVGRSTDPLQFSQINAADAALARAGNRFDVPGGGVVYLASDAETCFAETLARFRPSHKLREMAKQDASLDEGFMVVGGVPADWRSKRLQVTVELVDPLPFLDVDAPETVEFLNVAASEELATLDVGNLDVAALQGSNRLVTRTIAAWAYSATDENGGLLYSGIRYASRLNNKECWAVFQGTEFRETARDTIQITNPAFEQVAELYGLRPF